MIEALGMELEPIRTVLSNTVNEITVCKDRKRETEGYYTMVSIRSAAVRKDIAGRLASTGLFDRSSDFVGSFSHLDNLNLVFRYEKESRLEGREALYTRTFTDRKLLAVSFVTAIAESGLDGDVGRLLLSKENIHLSPTGKVYLNYFLDFSKLQTRSQADDFYRDVAARAFDILCFEYVQKYGQQVDYYPHELRLMFKKLQNKGFGSYSQIIAFIRALSDNPKEQRFGAARILDLLVRIKSFVFSHTTGFFVGILVLATLVYLGYQITIRVRVRRETRDNTSYAGLHTIGEVYLGEEDV